MFFLQFLLDRIDPHDGATRSFVECMLPAMMDNYACNSAKGGAHARDSELDEQTKRKFEYNADQSMVSHLLNGILPTTRLLNLLEEERLIAQPFSHIERCVYILSYLMHDINKILHIKSLATGDRAAIEQAKEIIAQQLRLCRADDFFPAFADYLEEITYLVVNTQEMWDTHLHTFLWRFRLPERRVLLLRQLCIYSDRIAYLVPSPSAILLNDGTKKLVTILSELSNNEFVFCYHQLREVRGLLTNVVNDGVVSLFVDGRAGIWPYLFFSDGVVYLKRRSLQIALTNEQVVEAVQAKIRETCANRIRDHAPGFKFSIQGIAKHPGYYFEFLTLEDYTHLLARHTILRTVNDVSTIPLAKLHQMQQDGEFAASLATDFAPDHRIGMFGRFLSVVFVTVLGLLDKKQQMLHEQVEREVVRSLELEPYWEQAKTIPNKGGVEYRWAWLAGCYLRAHSGLSIHGDERSLEALFHATLERIVALAGDALRANMPQNYLNHLVQYLESVVELPQAVRAGNALPDFHAEFERYGKAKSKKRALICTLCNSAYPTEEQSDNAVLFQPWVYKNKLSLYSGKNAGGICTICALELMLRQILQKNLSRLTGSKFEAQRTKYLAIYPNFFFTAETGAMVQGILDQLQNVNFFSVRRQLDGQDMSVRSLLTLETFAAPDSGAEASGFVSAHEGEDIDDEQADDVGEEEVATPKPVSPASSYMKYQQSAYPGLCFFGMPARKDDDDTSSWAMPAFLALALPLVTNTKVVVSESSLPLYVSGHDFRETVLFDAPHPYLRRLLKMQGGGVRVNELLPQLILLSHVYHVNLDTYARQGKPEWKHLSAITRDVMTDPLFLFSYLRKQQRRDHLDTMRSNDVQRYIRVYEMWEEHTLGKIQQCVDLYTRFYSGGYESHSILKPVDIVARAIIASPTDIEPDDLLWQIQGELKNWLDRVRKHQAKGYARFFSYKDIDACEAPAVREFVQFFHREVFLNYCQEERGELHSRLNRFKDGCEAYYVDQRRQKRIQEHEEPQGEVVLQP